MRIFTRIVKSVIVSSEILTAYILRVGLIAVFLAGISLTGWQEKFLGTSEIFAADAGGGVDSSGSDPDAGGNTGDPADNDPADDDPADDDPADDDPADDDPADDDPADDPVDEEPEDDDVADEDDPGEDRDEDADNEDIADDGDDDDDSESEEALAKIEERMKKHHVELDGLCSLQDAGKGLRRFGYIDQFVKTRPIITSDNVWSVAASPVSRQSMTEKIEELLPPIQNLVNASRPRYEKGDTYVYSDGTWEQVRAANQERVEWVNYCGNPSVGSPDFTYKRSQWRTTNRMGTRTFQQTSYIWDKPTDTLWPLAKKNKTRYDEEGRWVSRDGIERKYDSFWRCDVDGEERVTVAAGSFDTWRIRCARYPDSFSYPKSRAREYRTWYYAPSVEHWVLMERDNRGYRPDVRKELVAILPNLQGLSGNPQDIVQVQQQFQEVLESNENNQKDLWMAAAGNVAVTIEPHETFVNDDGVYCRQYRQEVQLPGMSRTYAGVGCRTPDGTWYIPRR